MADAHRAASPSHAEHGLLSRGFTAIAKIVLWLLFALVASIVIEWVGMTWAWPTDGVAHSRRLLDAERAALVTHFDRHLMVRAPAVFGTHLGEGLSKFIFERAHLDEVIAWSTTPPMAGQSTIRIGLRHLANALSNYLIATKQIVQLFGTRLSVLILALPTMMVCGVVAVIDGLVRRDVRRWRGGRESGFVYHWIKDAAVPLCAAPWFAYLVAPISLPPSGVIFCGALVFSLSITAIAATFKKYL